MIGSGVTKRRRSLACQRTAASATMASASMAAVKALGRMMQRAAALAPGAITVSSGSTSAIHATPACSSACLAVNAGPLAWATLSGSGCAPVFATISDRHSTGCIRDQSMRIDN